MYESDTPTMPAQKIINTMREFCTKKGFGELWTNFIVFMLLLSLTTTIHELTHVTVSHLVGCNGSVIEMAILTGMSAIECDLVDNDTALIIIAISAPLMLWVVGLYLWFLRSKDSMLRVWSLLCWFYGAIPSLSFWIAGSDAQFAAEHGLPLLWAFLVFAIPTAIIAVLISREITERKDVFGERFKPKTE